MGIKPGTTKPERGDIGDPGSEGIHPWPPGIWPENDDGP